MGGQVGRWALVAILPALVAVPACSSSKSSPARSQSSGRRLPDACKLLSRHEVESLVGEAVHSGSSSDLVENVGASTCRWGDADPASPGHVVTLRVAPASSVERNEPGSNDHVTDLPALGKGATLVRRADGGLGVMATAGGLRLDLEYDVYPNPGLRASAVDRLVALAGTVRSRLQGS